VRQLAVRPVDVAELGVQSQDRFFLPRQEAVHGVAAGYGIDQVVRSGAETSRPAHASNLDVQHLTAAFQRPAAGQTLIDQVQQNQLVVTGQTRGDGAYQAPRCFPRSRANSLACSVIVSVS
jgi:hypothetical protein